MRARLAALARDRVSGASTLARRAARLLAAAARDDGKSLARWQRRVGTVGRAIVAAQPAMGSVRTVVALAARAARRARTPAEGAAMVGAAMRAYSARQASALEAVASRLAPLLPRGATCLTISFSEAVYRALIVAHRRGRLARAIVAESRPGREGVTIAKRLAAHGIAVTVVVDALAPALVAEVDAVVVGADAVTRHLVCNKCGTLALALAARTAGRPVYVVTTEDRRLAPALARGLSVPAVEPRAVLARAPRGVRALNRLFDLTPRRLVTAVLTER
jgi:translation initiation factor 2B subunit (eIF-2B alpha/beta/delta family)